MPRSPEHEIEYYQHISPTAFVIAYERTFTDIPFSKEIFSYIQNKGIEGHFASLEKGLSNLAPRYEARYKLVDKLLDEVGETNVVEIAPGMSPRGLTYGLRSDRINYVELDLPHMSAMKATVIKKISDEFDLTSTGLCQVSGNALVKSDIDRAIAQLDDKSKPITFICEGLMRYFNFGEKSLLASHILRVLQERGGVWITPDITLKSFSGGLMKAVEQRVSEISGIDMSQNYFYNLEQAEEFFTKTGFSVKPRSFMEVKDNLSSPSLLGQDTADLEAILRPSTAFVLSPKMQ